MAIALFDFDRTLVDVNSGHLWLRHEMRAGRVSSRQAAWAAFWFLRYRLGFEGGLEAAFDQAVAAYAGLADAELDAWTETFFEAEIIGRLRPGARRALDAHRAAGDRVALASSTTQYLADRACAAWGLERAAWTTLEVEAGHLTGRIASLALGRHKTERVRDWAAAERIALDDITFYTDSVTDLDLLAQVGTPVAVNPDRRLRREARRRGWRVEDWGVVAPGPPDSDGIEAAGAPTTE